MRVGCILLAAGQGKRFGGNKLEAFCNGERLIGHALRIHSAADYDIRVLVTGPCGVEGAESAKETFDAVAVNPEPERGIASSVRTGIERLCLEAVRRGILLDGVLFGVCDQPGLTGETVDRILETFERCPDRIIVPVGEDGRYGNPVLFPVRFLKELSELEGDRGGGVVIKRHPDCLETVRTADNELMDIDTKEDIPLLER